MMKPREATKVLRVAVDVDGVLAEQVKPALRRVYSQYPPGHEPMKKEDIVSWVQPLLGTSTNIKDAIETALGNEDFVLSMDPIEGAVEGMQRMHAMDCTLTIATARHGGCEAWTKAWLKKWAIPHHEYLCTHGKDKAPATDFLIDDYPGHFTEYTKKGGTPILFDQPWNRSARAKLSREIPNLRIAQTWQDVVGIIGEGARR